MEFIGNYRSWIKPEWIQYLITNDGIKRPSGGNNPNENFLKKFIDSGYDITQTYWHHYTNETNTFPFDYEPPIKTNNKIMFWFIKMTPGQLMPIHRDPHVTELGFNGCDRFWMPLQDYEPGHIFMYNDFVITNYKAGDLYKYTDPNEKHCACNLGFTPRLTAQFTIFY